MIRTIPEAPGTLRGVKGTWRPRQFDTESGRIMSQVFRSGWRAIPGEGRLFFEARFDDGLKNGAPSFAITGTIYDPNRGGSDDDRAFVAGGCLHEEIAAKFPEVAGLIRWHLTDTRGPMHYVANTVFHAGDRDHNGLRKGEARQIIGRNGPAWQLRLIAPDGTESDIPRLYSNESQDGATAPPSPGRLEWRPWCRIGEGKPRDLAAARACAVWPDASDAELMAEPAELRAKLEARLPALLEAFRADMIAAGFLFTVPAEG